MIKLRLGPGIVEHLPALQRYARTLTRDDMTAEDLVHDALLLACEKEATFKVGGNLRAWLLSIVHNSFISGRRRQAAERARIERVAEGRSDLSLPAQEHAVRLAGLNDVFMSLPDEQRAVLHLIAVEGLSYGDAAAALDLPVGTVMSRLSRARAALRKNERLPASKPREAAKARRLRVVGGSVERPE